jgi:predicted DNA-binding protein
MFLKKKVPAEQFSCRFCSETVDKLKKLAKRHEISVAQIIAQIVEKELEKK